MTNLFVGAYLLIGALSSGMPPSVPQMAQVPEHDPNVFEDSLVELHMRAGLVDKAWILFDRGACATCCPEWFAPEYPVFRVHRRCGACLERHRMCKVERLFSLTLAMATR